MIKRQILLFEKAGTACRLSRDLIEVGWQVTTVSTVDKACARLIENKFKIAVACFAKADESWFRCLAELAACHRELKWIAVIDRSLLKKTTVRNLLAAYFHDYHTIPADTHRLLSILGHAYGMATLRSAVAPGGEGQDFQDYQDVIISSSGLMEHFLHRLNKVAVANAPVLITGESGTGKELVARAIHQQSNRASGPLMIVNCAALPASLIQAELFGYERGSFTGAIQRRIGQLEKADGGTLFLDEIGDLKSDLQVLLLRFLQEKTIRRVGGTTDIHVNARVIAATHVDLEEAMRIGDFREDLYHRLNVLRLEIPPLRERNHDIELLAGIFLKRFAREVTNDIQGFTPEALQALYAYHWPGNVRELMNCIHHAVVVCNGPLIKVEDLGLKALQGDETARFNLDKVCAEAEKKAVENALRLTGYNILDTAEMLGVSRATLYRLLKKHAISTDFARRSDKA